jgi:hypothetical protein
MTMLLPTFELHQPESLADAVALAKAHAGQCDFLSGGTDLLPNYKCGLNAKPHVISLQRVPELKQLDAHTIGAGVTLTELEQCAGVPTGVRAAAAQIASPLLRESGTVGGNLMLDNRCHFFNQSYFWRHSLGYCLKADGDVCHVVPRINEDGKSVVNNKVCVATHSSDLAPMLIALGAEATFVGPDALTIGGARALRNQVRHGHDWIPDFAKEWHTAGQSRVERATYGEEVADRDPDEEKVNMNLAKRRSQYIGARASMGEPRAQELHKASSPVPHGESWPSRPANPA